METNINIDNLKQDNDYSKKEIEYIESLGVEEITKVVDNIDNGFKSFINNDIRITNLTYLSQNDNILNSVKLPDNLNEVNKERQLVGKAQELLRSAGYGIPNSESFGVDGYFGPNTFLTIINFQSENGLEADGILGQKTLSKLLEFKDIGKDNEEVFNNLRENLSKSREDLGKDFKENIDKLDIIVHIHEGNEEELNKYDPSLVNEIKKSLEGKDISQYIDQIKKSKKGLNDFYNNKAINNYYFKKNGGVKDNGFKKDVIDERNIEKKEETINIGKQENKKEPSKKDINHSDNKEKEGKYNKDKINNSNIENVNIDGKGFKSSEIQKEINNNEESRKNEKENNIEENDINDINRLIELSKNDNNDFYGDTIHRQNFDPSKLVNINSQISVEQNLDNNENIIESELENNNQLLNNSNETVENLEVTEQLETTENLDLKDYLITKLKDFKSIIPSSVFVNSSTYIDEIINKVENNNISLNSEEGAYTNLFNTLDEISKVGFNLSNTPELIGNLLNSIRFLGPSLLKLATKLIDDILIYIHGLKDVNDHSNGVLTQQYLKAYDFGNGLDGFFQSMGWDNKVTDLLDDGKDLIGGVRGLQSGVLEAIGGSLDLFKIDENISTIGNGTKDLFDTVSGNIDGILEAMGDSGIIDDIQDMFKNIKIDSEDLHYIIGYIGGLFVVPGLKGGAVNKVIEKIQNLTGTTKLEGKINKLIEKIFSPRNKSKVLAKLPDLGNRLKEMNLNTINVFFKKFENINTNKLKDFFQKLSPEKLSKVTDILNSRGKNINEKIKNIKKVLGNELSNQLDFILPQVLSITNSGVSDIINADTTSNTINNVTA